MKVFKHTEEYVLIVNWRVSNGLNCSRAQCVEFKIIFLHIQTSNLVNYVKTFCVITLNQKPYCIGSLRITHL